MKYGIGDVIEVQGNKGYIDFEGRIEIIGVTDFNNAKEYQNDFVDWWFGEEDDFYFECKNTIKQVYIGKFVEGNHLTSQGKVIAFPEGFIDMNLTHKAE